MPDERGTERPALVKAGVSQARGADLRPPWKGRYSKPPSFGGLRIPGGSGWWPPCGAKYVGS